MHFSEQGGSRRHCPVFVEQTTAAAPISDTAKEFSSTTFSLDSGNTEQSPSGADINHRSIVAETQSY
jgi:hypothetical protein